MNKLIIVAILTSFLLQSCYSIKYAHHQNVSRRSVNKIERSVDKLNIKTPKHENVIQVCKLTVMSEIDNFNFDESFKDSLKKSIQNIPVLVTTQAYIKPIGRIHGFHYTKRKYKFAIKTKYNDAIFMSYYDMDDDYVKNILYHELYHYIDKLVGNKYGYFTYSDSIDYLKYIDSSIKSKESLCTKINFLIYFKQLCHEKVITPNQLLLTRYISSDIERNIFYFSSKTEMFSRYFQMKRYMVEHNIINSISDPICDEDIANMLLSFKYSEEMLTNNEMPDFFTFLIFIDVDKLADFDKNIIITKKSTE